MPRAPVDQDYREMATFRELPGFISPGRAKPLSRESLQLFLEVLQKSAINIERVLTLAMYVRRNSPRLHISPWYRDVWFTLWAALVITSGWVRRGF
jgi:hypothetical protein